MASLRAIVDTLDELLDSATFSDHGPNGVQVPRSTDDVATVVTGVSANGALLRAAAERGADLVLVHHGMFWRGDPLGVDRAQHRRLKLLIEHDIALVAYHLPLDAHPEHGNNALLARGLGLTAVEPFAAVGVRGRFDEPVPVAELVERVRRLVDHDVVVVPGGPPAVRTMSIVSGAGTDDARRAIELGIDAHLTGEPAERAFSLALDGGLTFLAAGHHATETLGVRSLGAMLAERFGVRHDHVDVRNPI